LNKAINAAKSENLSLKKELEEYKKKKDAAPQETFKLSDIEIPELGEDDDILEEEGQKKFKKILNAVPLLAKDRKVLADRNQQLEAEIKELKGNIEKVDKTHAEMEADTAQQEAIANELKEIDSVRKRPVFKDVFGEFTRPTKAIEDDYIAFVENLAVENGIEEPKDLRGRYKQEVMNLVNKYLDEKSEEGKKLRETLKVKMPEDYGVLDTIYSIRNLRYRDVGGQSVPVLPYEDATRLFMADENRLAEMKRKATKTALETKQRALDNRKGFAKETQPGAGSQQEMNISQAAAEQLIIKAVKKQASPEELTVLDKIIDHLKASGNAQYAAEIEMNIR